MEKLVQVVAYLIITKRLPVFTYQAFMVYYSFHGNKSFIPLNSMIHLQQAITCLFPNYMKHEIQKQKTKQNYLTKCNFKVQVLIRNGRYMLSSIKKVAELFMSSAEFLKQVVLNYQLILAVCSRNTADKIDLLCTSITLCQKSGKLLEN